MILIIKIKTKLNILIAAIAGLVLAHPLIAEEPTPPTKNEEVGKALRFKVSDIDGKPVDLSSYRGKVVLFVNVASKCGLTPQYEKLQSLHEKFAEKGLCVLGFPANQFGGQEPGTNGEIKAFCSTKYSVSFPLFAKVVVKGDDICDLYAHLTSVDTKPKGKGDISWNFEKILVGRDGEVVARFAPRVEPDSKEFVDAVQAALAQS